MIKYLSIKYEYWWSKDRLPFSNRQKKKGHFNVRHSKKKKGSRNFSCCIYDIFQLHILFLAITHAIVGKSAIKSRKWAQHRFVIIAWRRGRSNALCSIFPLLKSKGQYILFDIGLCLLYTEITKYVISFALWLGEIHFFIVKCVTMQWEISAPQDEWFTLCNKKIREGS